MADVRELTPEDAPELTALYEEYEWWEDREVADVRGALADSEVALGVESDAGTDSESGDLVAADRRGEGVGETLLAAVLDHPDLQALPGLSLLCREGLVGFYESVGFEVFGPEFEVPEGGTEELVRMTDSHAERDGSE